MHSQHPYQMPQEHLRRRKGESRSGDRAREMTNSPFWPAMNFLWRGNRYKPASGTEYLTGLIVPIKEGGLTSYGFFGPASKEDLQLTKYSRGLGSEIYNI